jgi:hypothetical protein
MVHHWNGKYLLELEAGPFKQTFKIPEAAVEGPDAVKSIVNEEFISECLVRFESMMKSLKTHMKIPSNDQ